MRYSRKFLPDIAALQRKIGEWNTGCNKVPAFVKKVFN